MQHEFEVNAKTCADRSNHRFQCTVESRSSAMEKLTSVIGDKVPEPLRADAASHKPT